MSVTNTDEESVCIAHEPCPKCGSRDNLGRYNDGHGWCFGCGYREPATGTDQCVHTGNNAEDVQSRGIGLLPGEYEGLPKRGLSEETCRRFSYLCGEDKHGTQVQIAPYRDRDGRVVAQKLRYGDKRGFPWVGVPKGVRLYGSHLFGSGKKLVVTEGEVDCMSVSQMQDHKWPVVSLINGAQGGKKDLLANMDYLENFEEIILMFDMDEPGQKAAVECAKALSHLKVKIASLPMKDPNELLVAGRGEDIRRAMWNAVEWRPEGIVEATALKELFLSEEELERVDYPFPSLNVLLHGMRTSELVTITAGTGTGKSAFVREIVSDLHKKRQRVGVLMLEESLKRTIEGLVSIHLSLPVHTGRDVLSREKLSGAFDEAFAGERIVLLDHFGSTDVDDLISKIRYMAKALGCTWIILDHISIVVSGMQTNDERRAIDETMTKLRTLVQEAKIGLIVVSHLRRNSGDADNSHERGGEISLSHLRGSHSIAQLSDIVIALERDQQSDDTRDVTTVRVLKNRYTGETGLAGLLKWDHSTARLTEMVKGFKDESNTPSNF